MKWLQLDTDMPHDPKIRAVDRALGVEGVGGLVQLWCFVARHGAQPGRALDTAGERLPLEDIRDATELDEAKFQQLLDICLRTGHFKRDEWEQRQGIWIPAMQRRADTYTRRKQQREQGTLW
jgi:hypothetical protein